MKTVCALSRSWILGLSTLGLCLAATAQPAFSQGVAPSGSTSLWKSDHAKYLIGLSEIKAKIVGTLALSPTEFIFTTPNGQTSLQRSQIIAVSVGGERRETGGTIGKLGRMAIPYGGGSAVAMVTHAQVDLLTIEYRDVNHAYHGVVFLLPKNEATPLRDIFPMPESQKAVDEPSSPCAPDAAQPATLKVSTINVTGAPLPAAYKVLLYEQLMRRLQQQADFKDVVRDGDQAPAAACANFTLTLTVNAFTKGNAVLRASAGPLGFFLGATSLKFHVLIQDAQHKSVFQKDLKASQRGDSESLDITDRIAKTVTKKLKKLGLNAPEQSKDRFVENVPNSLVVVQPQEALVTTEHDCTSSLNSHNLAKISLSPSV